MNRLCQNSWGSHERGWVFCTLDRAHPGPCMNSAYGVKPDTALFFHEQPEASGAIEKQRLAQAKIDAKKAK